MAAKQHSLYQITSFVDVRSVDTFCDGTLVTRNPRCGQWLRLGWMPGGKRSRFIGVSLDGVIVVDHTSGGNFEAFSDKVRAFKRANDRQLRLF